MFRPAPSPRVHSGATQTLCSEPRWLTVNKMSHPRASNDIENESEKERVKKKIVKYRHISTCKFNMELVFRFENLDVKRAVRSEVFHSPGPQNGLVILSIHQY